MLGVRASVNRWRQHRIDFEKYYLSSIHFNTKFQTANVKCDIEHYDKKKSNKFTALINWIRNYTRFFLLLLYSKQHEKKPE